MGHIFKIFHRGLRSERRKMVNRTRAPYKEKPVISFTFLPMKLEEQGEIVEILYNEGEKTRFFGKTITIVGITFDKNFNIIYEAEFENGVRVSIYQELLKPNSEWKELSISSSRRLEEVNIVGDATFVEEMPIESEKKELAPISFTMPEDFEPLETAMQKSNLLLQQIHDAQTSIDESQKKSIEMPKSIVSYASKKADYDLEEALEENSRRTVEKMKITIEEIFAFLDLKYSVDLEQVDAILKIYKFLVQNPGCDDAIVEEESRVSNNNLVSPIASYKKSRNTSLAFKILLSKIGIKSDIIAVKEANGYLHNALLVTTTNRFYFFDIECERAIYEKLEHTSKYFFNMAYKGMQDYSEHRDIMGVFSEDGSHSLLPLPNTVCKESVSKFIIEGFNRQIPDLTYSADIEKRKKLC